MSANSDSAKLLTLARDLGFRVEKVKHGGYRVLDGDEVVARVPHGGKGQPPFAVAAARRQMTRRRDGKGQ